MTANAISTKAPARSKWWRIGGPVAGVIVPGIINALYLGRFAVNVIFWDEWLFVPLLRAFRSGADWLPALWAPLNEHRLFFPKLLFLGLAQASNWNVIVEMYVSFGLVCLSLLGLWLIYRQLRPTSLWGFVPAAWLVFSLGQHENILYGIQLALYLNVLALIWSIYWLSLRSPQALRAAVIMGLIASFSVSSGLLIWPVGLVMLWLRRADRKSIGLWLAAGVLVVALYYAGYQAPPGRADLGQLLARPLVTAQFFLANVGAPLAAAHLDLAVLVGVGVVALFGLFALTQLISIRRLESIPAGEIAIGGLILISLLTSLAIAVGRSAMGLEGALSSRYTTQTTPGIIGALWIALNWRQSPLDRLGHRWTWTRKVFYPALAVIVVGLVLVNQAGLKAGQSTYDARLRLKYILQTFEIQSESALAQLYLPASVHGRAPYLRAESLNAFNDPVAMMLPPSYADGQPLGEILPDRPVMQTVRCPVNTVTDVGILFATYDRVNHASIQVSLRRGETEVWRQTLLATDIQNNAWLRWPLSQPIENCLGQMLTVQIESPDASAGDAYTVWAFPKYYDGSLIEPPDPAFATRVIGLEFNTLSMSHVAQ